ncbi:MAG: hypothetical protein LBQ54_16655 [Planctomycetaceae bacterium]|nr:hypothetical protein [Planctomycetaceae bacterium]
MVRKIIHWMPTAQPGGKCGAACHAAARCGVAARRRHPFNTLMKTFSYNRNPA